MHTNITQYIDICRAIKNNMTITELAKRSNQSPQNLNNKLKRGNYRVVDLEQIAEAFDCDVQIKFIDRTTGKAIDNLYAE